MVEPVRVAVTGVGAVTPLGVGAETLHRRWTAGESGIEDGLGRADFDASEHLSRRDMRSFDRFTQFALVAANEALGQAGWLDELPYDSERIACVVGTGMGGVESLESDIDRARERGHDQVSPLTIAKHMPNAAAAAISARYGLHGESMGVCGACASGAIATGAAMGLLRSGAADAVVTGSSDAGITPQMRAVFGVMGASSRAGVSRPFDRRRDGFVGAEGGGILVIEREEGARARGAEPVGFLCGYGVTCDAHHVTAPEPSGRQAARAIERALQEAGLAPEDLSYVNMHGTGTPLNDRAETKAVKLALGEVAERIPMSSLKSAIGHLGGGAASVEAVATLLALRDRVAPPTLNLEEPEEGLDLDYVPGEARRLRDTNGSPPAAISNSFGFGGHNAVLAVSAA
ncbi:MAG TPA: beta-ketoacyl-[acyl-carrier-protein] synthase family protein [Thermoleophilaceae bacterium]